MQAKGQGLVAYLRTLYVIHRATIDLVKRLASSYSQKSFIQQQGEGAKITVLQSLVTALFSPYIETAEYLELEAQTLTECLQIAIAPLQQALQQRRQSSTTTMAAIFSSSKSSHPPALSEIIHRGTNLLFSQQKPLVTQAEGENCIPVLEVVERCIVLHAEATVRSFRLLPNSKCGPAIESLFRILLQNIIERYIEATIDLVLDLDEFGAGSKIGYTPMHFELVYVCSRILASLQIYFENSLTLVAVETSPASYRTMVQLKSDYFARITEKIDKLLRCEVNGIIIIYKATLGILDWIAGNTLSKQKKTDFRPRAEDFAAFSLSSLVHFLSSNE